MRNINAKTTNVNFHHLFIVPTLENKKILDHKVSHLPH